MVNCNAMCICPPPLTQPLVRLELRRTRAGAWLAAGFAASLLVFTTAAQAHDTWFEPRGQRGAGGVFIALGTGNQFPLHDTAVDAQYLERRGCREAGQAVALEALGNTSTALLLRTRPKGSAAMSCWAQLVSFEIELEASLIALYFEEANASAAVRDAWRAMQARGVKWKERYTKQARIEIDGEARAGGWANASPGDMAIDLLLERPPRPLRVGDTVRAQLLRDGRPVAGFPLQLRRAQQTVGAWQTTDAEGRVTLSLPAADRWLLRGIDIRPSPSEPDAWETRFVSLAFGVTNEAAKPAASKPGSAP